MDGFSVHDFNPHGGDLVHPVVECEGRLLQGKNPQPGGDMFPRTAFVEAPPPMVRPARKR